MRRLRRGAMGNCAISGKLKEMTHTTLAQLEEINARWTPRNGEHKRWTRAVMIQPRWRGRVARQQVHMVRLCKMMEERFAMSDELNRQRLEETNKLFHNITSDTQHKILYYDRHYYNFIVCYNIVILYSTMILQQCNSTVL